MSRRDLILECLKEDYECAQSQSPIPGGNDVLCTGIFTDINSGEKWYSTDIAIHKTRRSGETVRSLGVKLVKDIDLIEFEGMGVGGAASLPDVGHWVFNPRLPGGPRGIMASDEDKFTLRVFNNQ